MVVNYILRMTNDLTNNNWCCPRNNYRKKSKSCGHVCICLHSS